MIRHVLLRSTAAVLAWTAITPASAEEGIWTFDNFPAAKVKAAYGVEINKRWLDHVMGAEVRLSNGCSASLVSSTGLVSTANHCISEYVQSLSPPGHDDYENGFVATDRRKEKQAIGLTAEVLTSIADVTPQILRAESGLNGDALLKAHSQTVDKLETDACAGDTASRCQVVNFYHGGQYKLYKYRKYGDVRLVFSPGVSAQAFGDGEFPPYAFDAAFVRLYQGGAPARTPDHLSWNSSAPHAGEAVFVAGNPRRSERELTLSQLQTQRDLTLPYELIQSAELIGRLTRFSEESKDNQLASHFELYDIKNYYGYELDLLNTLNAESFFPKKEAERAALEAKARSVFQPQWAAIAQAEQARRRTGLAYEYLVGGPTLSGGPASELFDYARTLVRGALERANPSTQRSPGYGDSQLPLREKSLSEGQPVNQSLEKVQLEDWLDRVQEYLPPGDPTAKLLLGAESADELAARLSRSRLGDVELRKRLWSGGIAAIQASDDPMIRYMLHIEPAAIALNTKWHEEVVDPETRATGLIAQEEFKLYGTSFSPDANGTLRISYGRIEGLTHDGETVGPFSTFKGLLQGATGHDPYKLNPRWIAAESMLSPDTILDMSTTNDTINGNSGSPMLNSRSDIIGVFGGGNSFAMGGDYSYDPDLNRAYGVTAQAITEALLRIYGAGNLVAELTSPANGPPGP